MPIAGGASVCAISWLWLFLDGLNVLQAEGWADACGGLEWARSVLAEHILRDRRDISPTQLSLRRADVNDHGLHVVLRVPDLALCGGFLSIEFDLLEPAMQEQGSASWRHKNSSYLYYVTLSRS